ncbi:MAG TPA: two-component sensor histidine kinase, partial [Actinobacteria bacterium]|nr:two-component sensor histidine kinase [Actinomycetota bacterium]
AIVEVADDGVGIPSSDLPRVFERFYRVDEGRSRRTGGTGLGLAIVKHVAEEHGGHVEAESVLSEGSAFRIVIPLES